MNDKYSKMGNARARKLSSEQRSEIAKNAARQRWNSSLPVALSEGVLKNGELELPCVVLPDETRVITQKAFLEAIGRSRSFRGGTGVKSTADSIPFFLQSSIFKPYADKINTMPAKPIFYQSKTGARSVGYNALLLPAVAELYLQLRDDYITGTGSVPIRFQPYVQASDILIRGLANVGIIALVDEATGYQNRRAKDSLAKILEQFIAKDLQPYVKTFPDEFYENMYRLRKLIFVKDYRRHPQYFGTLTNDIIYSRLAPSVLEELKKASSDKETRKTKTHMHRHLTADVGHPKLREHLASVVTLMKISSDYKQFMALLNQVHPKFDSNLSLPLGDIASPKLSQ